LKRTPEALTAREMVKRHAPAAVEGRTGVAIADIAPEAMPVIFTAVEEFS